MIINEYINNKLSPKDIYIKYNCADYGINNSETILHMLKNMGIKTRTLSQSVVNAHKQGKLNLSDIHNQYNCGHHKTWYGGDVYYRSSYELEYALELDAQKIYYTMEEFRISYFNSIIGEERCAIPDFYIKETNTIVEVKSNYTLNVQEMKDKFIAYKKLGYNCKLLLEHKFVDLDTL